MRSTILFLCTFLCISVTSSCKKNKSSLSKETSFFQDEIHNSVDGLNNEVVYEVASSELNLNDSSSSSDSKKNSILSKRNTDLVKKSRQQTFAEEEFPIIFFGMINT